MNRSVPVHIVRKSWIILGPKRLFLNQMHQSLLTASRHGWLGCACSTEIGRNSALPTSVVVAVLTEQIACGKSDAMSLLRIQSQRVGRVLDGWDQKMQPIGPDN